MRNFFMGRLLVLGYDAHHTQPRASSPARSALPPFQGLAASRFAQCTAVKSPLALPTEIFFPSANCRSRWPRRESASYTEALTVPELLTCTPVSVSVACATTPPARATDWEYWPVLSATSKLRCSSM